MKISTVCLALLLMAATAEAQGRGVGGFHGGGGGFRSGGGVFHGGGLHAGTPMFRDNSSLRPGFRPGDFNSGVRPGFDRGFRSGFARGFRRNFGGFDNRSVAISPFFGFPFFSIGIDPLNSGPIFTPPTYITPDQTTQSISDQTSEDLRSQVGQLTTEVQQLQAELAASGQSTPISAAAQNPPAVTLILKDGRRIEAAGYALVGSTLWILNANNATKISLSDVDVDATQKENQKRGINMVIPPNTSQRRLR
jgi:hypothetical protein